jgi:hypothetical protein
MRAKPPELDRTQEVAGSSPASSIIDQSPLRLTPQHDDCGRFSSDGQPKGADAGKAASATA